MYTVCLYIPVTVHTLTCNCIHFANARPQKYVWHGSDMTGERTLSAYCDAWNTGASGAVGLASSLLKKHMLGQELMSCHNSFVVLCIEATSQSRSRRRRHAGSEVKVVDEAMGSDVIGAAGRSSKVKVIDAEGSEVKVVDEAAGSKVKVVEPPELFTSQEYQLYLQSLYTQRGD